MSPTPRPVHLFSMRLLALRTLVVAAVAVLVIGVGTSAGQPRSVETEAQGIFARVMSPYCPGLLLANCPSSLAEDLRQEIRAQLREGRTPDEVESGLYARFGDTVRAIPPARGIGMLLWTMPPLAFAVSALALAVVLKRWQRAQAATPADRDMPRESAALDSRLQDELDAI